MLCSDNNILEGKKHAVDVAIEASSLLARRGTNELVFKDENERFLFERHVSMKGF